MQAFVVHAQTKRFTKSAKGQANKTVKGASKTLKGAADKAKKTVQKAAPKKAVQKVKKAAGSGAGAQNWYGPDRAQFLGTSTASHFWYYFISLLF